MNLNFINQEFQRLATVESAIDYEFEPKSKIKNGKRNIYYEDLKNDFINEVNTFGFSPFILENFEKQRKNPNIMKYMDKKFNHGLTNYVKMQNKSIKINPLSGSVIKKKSKTAKKKIPILENTFYLKRKEVVKEKDKKDNFLQKAFENLGGNKLNISSDDDEENINSNQNMNNKNNKENTKTTNKAYDEVKNKLAAQLREKYMKPKDYAHPLNNNNVSNSLPQISISEFNKPEALKINFEKFFSENNNKNDYKKIVALSKNKEFLISKKDGKVTTSVLKNENKQKSPITKMPTKFNNMKKYKNILVSPSKNKNEKFLLFEKSRPLQLMKKKEIDLTLKMQDLIKEFTE